MDRPECRQTSYPKALQVPHDCGFCTCRDHAELEWEASLWGRLRKARRLWGLVHQTDCREWENHRHSVVPRSGISTRACLRNHLEGESAMKHQRLFRCVECGGDVFERTGPGRRALYRLGVELPVPDTFRIPTCAACGETYLTASQGAKLSKLQAAAFDTWLTERATELIDQLRTDHQTTLSHLAGACGVTPTLLSKITNGKKTSLTLVRLLESFAASPILLQRLLEGKALVRDQNAARAILASSKPMEFGWSNEGSNSTPRSVEYLDMSLPFAQATHSNDLVA